MPEALLFAGPSAWGLPDTAFTDAGVRRLPPVRRGDVERAVADAGEPGVMIVCDGVFQIAPAVSHAELCGAIDAGWQVWGVSSLGAIRAWELRGEGMHGFGEVYAMFDRFDDFTDDEMCLLHCPEPPYFPASEALVNLRHVLDVDGLSLGVPAASAQALLDALRRLWFGDRTHERIRAAMLADARLSGDIADALLARVRTHRVKTMDLEQLLAQRPWRSAFARAGTP